MQRFILLFTAFGLGWLAGCNDCTTCQPFTAEPYVKIQFLQLQDSAKRVIIIDSINNIYTKEFRHFNDTTNEFKFPLDMHHDTSVFAMVYRDTDALDNYLTNTITLIYDREFFRRDDNYVVVRCYLKTLTTDFAADRLTCKDSLTCISNEATARIYN